MVEQNGTTPALDRVGVTADGGRCCVWWRCGNGCWGLPGCQHPDRTPFYLIRLPTIEELRRRDMHRQWRDRAAIAFIGAWVVALAASAAALLWSAIHG